MRDSAPVRFVDSRLCQKRLSRHIFGIPFHRLRQPIPEESNWKSVSENGYAAGVVKTKRTYAGPLRFVCRKSWRFDLRPP